MHHLNCSIQIGGYLFEYCHRVLIESSWRNLTDLCRIELPRKLNFEGKSLKDLIKPNLRVLVQLGYDGVLNTEFEGFVTRISPDVPLTVYCEDNMKGLKENNVVFSAANVTLAGLMGATLPLDVEFEADSIKLGAFRVDNESSAKILKRLKNDYGVYSFFRDGVLQVGLPPIVQDIARFSFQKNIIRHTLKYREEDARRFRVKCISMLPDGTKIEVEKGDDSGELRTFHYYDMEESALVEICNSRLETLKYEGYEGGFTTFGVPFVRHAGIADISDNNFTERAGRYRIDGIKVDFGVNGFKRTIDLGVKV